MRRMRIVAVAAVVQILVVGSLAFAQGPGGRRHGGGPGGPGGPGFGGPAAVLRGLDLSEAQRMQVKAIVERHHQEARAETFALLTSEQQAKFRQAQADQAARLKRRLEKLEQQ